MSMRDNLDISAYLVLGPENTLGRPVADVVAQAIQTNGFASWDAAFAAFDGR